MHSEIVIYPPKTMFPRQKWQNPFSTVEHSGFSPFFRWQTLLNLQCAIKFMRNNVTDESLPINTNSVSSKYTLDPIHRMMKNTGTPVEKQKTKTNISEIQSIRIDWFEWDFLMSALICAARRQGKLNIYEVIAVYMYSR